MSLLRHHIDDWFATARINPDFSRFGAQFTLLEGVVGEMLRGLGEAYDGAASITGSGDAYERCRRLDAGLRTVRHLFTWYTDKYDQRKDPALGDVLAAADQIVLSCWHEPFTRLRRTPPGGPLPYVEPRFDAYSTSREAVPAQLRGPADSTVAELTRSLPIPLVCLPEWSAQEGWWLVVAAHETGHHLHGDLDPGLRAATREALARTTGDEMWRAWAAEAFADAYSVLMTGPAAAWIIEELEHAGDSALFTPPYRPGPYPPPVVRLALLAELVRAAGIDVAVPVPGLDRARGVPGLARHLDAVPAAARALLDLRVESARVGPTSLRELSGLAPEWFSPGGRGEKWTRRLTGGLAFPSGLKDASAARVLIAAGVGAATGPVDEPTRRRVHRGLLDNLAACGPERTLGAAPARPEITRVAESLTARLLAGLR
ncbi:hypothetical protein [Rhizohabitans arisaemae]|uniref:hypothetical protein n=1 Tax=Rhizohabitans arisaemae TaxID=2720610 RepID=UPI0024B1CB53|nr:hypothetical protein [Rhizohabitans arisaemae]